MGLFRYVTALLPLYSSLVAADRLTGAYPPPLDLASNQSLVAAGWRDLSSVFDQYLINGDRNVSDQFAATGLENLTFSLGMFSLHDPAAINLQYHHTGPEVANAQNGTNKVDGDSIYIVASISKLITTYTAMLSFSEEDWNRPLTNISSDFKKYFNGSSDPIWNIQWDKITPWSLATQLSGLPTIGLLYPTNPTDPGDLYNASKAAIYGAPQVDLSKWSSWAPTALEGNTYISLSDAIATIANIPPNFQPYTTPAYSDLNFFLLGTLMSNITNQSLPALYHDTVFAPLGMTSSNITAPTDPASLAHAVLPLSTSSGFMLEPAFLAPSGGILSTVHDLQRLATGILNHTLLSPEATRKWMKPTSHTASLTFSVGAPWEILRYIHPNSTRVTDLYTKSGSSGCWGGEVVIIPEYNAGFVMLAEYTGPTRGSAQAVVLDYVANYVLPALEAQAAAEAKANFVGTYTTDSIPDTSITIGYEPGKIGYPNSAIYVSNWTYNGTDVLKGPFFNGSKSPLYLEPSIPNPNIDQAGQVAFQAGRGINYLTYVDALNTSLIEPLAVIGPFTGSDYSNMDFFTVDYERWAGVGADMFVFDVDADGKSTALTPAVDRVKLKKVA